MMIRTRHRRGRIAAPALLAMIALSALPSAALADEWFDAAPLPGPRAFHMTAFVATDSGPRIFAIGGQRSPSDTMERLCIAYSPQSNSWNQRSAMNRRRGLGQACTVRGDVWVLGGCRTFGAGLSYVEAYDPSGDAWSSYPNMPVGLYDFGAAVWRDSLVFIIGGGSWHPSMPPTAIVRLFNPALQAWYVATPLPIPLGAMACGIVGDTLLVATGWTNSGPTNRAWRGILNPADPTAISWQETDTLPGPRRCRSVCGIADRALFIIGGLESDAGPSLASFASPTLQPAGFSALSDAWSLTGTGQWTERAAKPRAVSCVFGSGSVPANRVCVPGGYPGAAPYLSATECLDASSYTHDVGLTSIVSPAGRLTPISPCSVSVTIRNFGSGTESFDAHIAVIDSATQSLVFSADTSLSLAPDSSRRVAFGTFTPQWYRVFRTTAGVELTGDENPGNDTLHARSRTTTGSDPDGYGYVYKTTQEPDNISFSWVDTTGGTVIDDWEPNNDEGTVRRNLPFQINFYATAVDRVYVCTNGYLQTSNNVAGLNFPLPYEGITNIIAPFWDDLWIDDSSRVYENSTTDRAVYTWANVRRAQSGSGRLTFQVVLQLNGDIRFNYRSVTADASSSTIGIQGGDGSWSWYQEYVYNADPARHVPTGSTSILFDKPPLGITDRQMSPAPLVDLHVQSLSRGPVRFTLGADVSVLQVFNISGSLVRTLSPPSSRLATPASLTWDRRDQHGRLLPAGAYIIRGLSGSSSLTRKIILLD